MSRFLKDGNAWIILGVVVVVAAWTAFGYAWFTGVLTLKNVLIIPIALWVFSLVAFAVLLGMYLVWTVVGEPIVAIVRLRPRQPRLGT